MATDAALRQCFCCCPKLLKKECNDEEIRIQRLEAIRSRTSAHIQTENIIDESESSTTIPQEEESHNSCTKVLQSLFHASVDNKLALKLYGSKKNIISEQNRQRRNGCSTRWMIHPFSHFRWYWDMLMVVLLIYTVTVLPVSIAFFSDTLTPAWLTINTITDTLFVMDIIINFRTGIISTEGHPDIVILEPCRVAKKYVKGWFIIDALSSVPFDYVTLIATQGSEISSPLLKASRALRILRLTKMISLLRLLRISRLLRYIQRWEDLFNLAGGVLRIFKLIVLMLLLAHWNGCVQFIVPMLQDIPPSSWLSINKLQNATEFEQYSWSLFKAISHMLCIGFGRWPPQNTTEAWLTIISMMVGATFYALFIGNMSTLLLSIDSSGRLYNEKLNQVEEYMRYRKLPQVIRQRVTDYYEHRYKHKCFNENKILAELSQGLREDIIIHNCKKLVEAVPFFKEASKQFVLAITTKLQFEVFLKGECIVLAGTKGDRMFFIQSGIVDVLNDDGEVAISLTDGAHFGEICLLTDDRRVASIIAATTSDLFSLSKQNFELLLEEFPDMRKPLENIALSRLAKLGKKVSEETTRKRGKLSMRVPPPPIQPPDEHNIQQHLKDRCVITHAQNTIEKQQEHFRQTLTPLKNRPQVHTPLTITDPNLIPYESSKSEEESGV